MKVDERNGPEHAAYVDTVRRGLHDAPRPLRDELLSDLRTRLDELPSGADPTEVLGTGEEYARLARDAAGCAPVTYGRIAKIRAWSIAGKITLVVIPLLALLVVGAGVWRAHYQPLEVVTIGGSSTADVVETNVPSNADYWRYEPGATVVVTAQLINHGRSTVTVTGVDVPDGPGPFRPAELRFTRNHYDMGVWQRGTPAHRFSVHPGETVYMFVVLKIAAQTMCAGCTESEDLPSLHVEVLGVHHVVPISGRPIGVLKQT